MLIPVAVVGLYFYAMITERLWGTQFGIWILLYTLISIATGLWFYYFGFDILGDLKDQWYYDLELDAEEAEKEKRKLNQLQRQNNVGTAYNKEPLIQSNSGDPDGEDDISDDPNEGHTPYLERDRAIGYGPLRIGTKFCFTEDIYSLLFIAFVHKEYKEERQMDKKRRRKLLAERLQIDNSSDTDS